MDTLLTEIKEKEEQAIENQDELLDAKSNLLNNLIWKISFSVVSLLNAGLACTGAKGAAASAIFGLEIDVSETFLLGSMEERREKISKIGVDLKSAAKEVKKQAEVIAKFKKIGQVQEQKYFLKEALIKSEGIEGLSWRTFTEEEIDGMTDESVEKKQEEIRVDVERKKFSSTRLVKLEKLVEEYDKLIEENYSAN